MTESKQQTELRILRECVSFLVDAENCASCLQSALDLPYMPVPLVGIRKARDLLGQLIKERLLDADRAALRG